MILIQIQIIICISLNNNNQYYSYICIVNKWFNFLNGQILMIDNIQNSIYTFEPQLLIYEREEFQNNLNPQMMMNMGGM